MPPYVNGYKLPPRSQKIRIDFVQSMQNSVHTLYKTIDVYILKNICRDLYDIQISI